MKPNLKNKLFFKKFRAGKLISNTNLAFIYSGINESNKEPVAMKFEKILGKYNFLESEAYFLYLLQGMGIPKLISYGKSFGYRVLIEELLGESISLIEKIKYRDFKIKLKDICLIAVQCLDRLEYVHSKNIIHRDIKPLNFLVGRKDPNLIYLIDFGISKKYRSSRTGKHIKFGLLTKTSGSIRYLSINTCKGYIQSRRDDLESLGYMLIYLTKKNLPWLSVEKLKISMVQKKDKILDLIKKTKPEEICSGLPKEFFEYVKYCRKLSFEEDPNYNYLRNLFLDIIQGYEKFFDYRFFDSTKFSWIKNNSKIGKKKPFSNNNLSMTLRNENNSLSREKNNTHRRLYKLIKDSFEKPKNLELSTINNNHYFNLDFKNINIILNNSSSKKKSQSQNHKNNEKKLKIDNKTTESNNSCFNKNKIPINKIKTNVKKIPIKKIDNFIETHSFKLKKNFVGNNKAMNTLQYIDKNRYNKIKLNNQIRVDTSKLNTYTPYQSIIAPTKSLNSFKIYNYKSLKERESSKKSIKIKSIFNGINNNNLIFNWNSFTDNPAVKTLNNISNRNNIFINRLIRNKPLLKQNIFYDSLNNTEDNFLSKQYL